jgi:hypothetical protein
MGDGADADPPGSARVALCHDHAAGLVARRDEPDAVLVDEPRDEVQVPIAQHAEDDLGALGRERIGDLRGA